MYCILRALEKGFSDVSPIIPERLNFGVDPFFPGGYLPADAYIYFVIPYQGLSE